MIAMLHGQVAAVDQSGVVLDVSGVGFDVRMPQADLASLHSGQSATVYTSMAVTQDAITLYGFLSSAEKKMFLQLQKVSGIGPKVALSLLSTLPPDRLARAVADGDATALAKAPGLGKKGAQKIILELKGSLDLSQVEGASAPAQSPVDTGAQQVAEGLISLGWHQQDALDAVERACRDHDIETPIGEKDVPRVLKLALTELDRGR
jgi:Holliday junction DNA helicase RuvA